MGDTHPSPPRHGTLSKRLNLEAAPKAKVLETKRWRGVSAVQRRLESRHPLSVAAHSRIQAERSLRREGRNPPPPRLLADEPAQGRRRGLNLLCYANAAKPARPDPSALRVTLPPGAGNRAHGDPLRCHKAHALWRRLSPVLLRGRSARSFRAGCR